MPKPRKTLVLLNAAAGYVGLSCVYVGTRITMNILLLEFILFTVVPFKSSSAE